MRHRSRPGPAHPRIARLSPMFDPGLRLFVDQRGIRIGRVPKYRHARKPRQKLFQQFEPLRTQVRHHEAHPRDVAARSSRSGTFLILPSGRLSLVTMPAPSGSAALIKTIGIVVVAAFAAFAGSVPPTATITPTLRSIK